MLITHISNIPHVGACAVAPHMLIPHSKQHLADNIDAAMQAFLFFTLTTAVIFDGS